MRILVTGGAGFIGSNLVRFLLGDGPRELGTTITRVVTLDKLTYAGNRSSLADVESDPRHRFIMGDIGDAALVAHILHEENIGSVAHLAAESHVDRSIADPLRFVKTNVVGTCTLLEAFRAHSAAACGQDATRRFLHVSTDEVFGSLNPGEPDFREDSPYSPNSPYSASKAGGDHLARAWHHTYGLPVVITHSSNNYGPRQHPEKLLPLMIGRTLAGGPLPVYGDGTNVRDWLYVEDHCRALAMALFKGEPGRAYLVGAGCGMTNNEVVRAIIETVRELAPGRVTKSADELITYVPDRPGHDLRYALDTSRIRNELGWSPRTSFTSGLRRTVEWYLGNEEPPGT